LRAGPYRIVRPVRSSASIDIEPVAVRLDLGAQRCAAAPSRFSARRSAGTWMEGRRLAAWIAGQDGWLKAAGLRALQGIPHASANYQDGGITTPQ